MDSSKIKAWLFFSVTVILVAIIYKRKTDNALKEKLDQVLSGLLRAERKVGVDATAKIALGFGGCEDIFVDALPLLERLKYNVPGKPEHIDDLDSEEDVTKIFAYFFRHGAAAEYVLFTFAAFFFLTWGSIIITVDIHP